MTTHLPPDRAHLMEALAKAIAHIAALEKTVAKLRAENTNLRAEVEAHVLLNVQQESELDRLKEPPRSLTAFP